MQNPPSNRLYATTTDRLTAIFVLASIANPANFETHAGMIARLLNCEEYETVENAFVHLDSDDAVEALEMLCQHYEDKVDLEECGGSQDRDTGMWEETARYDAVCVAARNIAAGIFFMHVREGLVRDLYELTPARLAVKRAREIAMEANAQVVS